MLTQKLRLVRNGIFDRWLLLLLVYSVCACKAPRAKIHSTLSALQCACVPMRTVRCDLCGSCEYEKDIEQNAYAIIRIFRDWVTSVAATIQIRISYKMMKLSGKLTNNEYPLIPIISSSLLRICPQNHRHRIWSSLFRHSTNITNELKWTEHSQGYMLRIISNYILLVVTGLLAINPVLSGSIIHSERCRICLSHWYRIVRISCECNIHEHLVACSTYAPIIRYA